MAVLATETWTGATGAAWPAAWTVQGGATGTSVATIQANRGRLTGTASYVANAWMGRATAAAGDFDELVTFTSATAAPVHVGMSGGSSGGNAPSNGYYARLVLNGTNVGDCILQRTSSGSDSQIGYAWADVAKSATGWTVRLKRTGATLQVRVWSAGAAEPSTWQLTVTDATPITTALRPFLALDNNAGSVDFDDLIVTDGATAAAIPAGTAAGTWTFTGTAAGVAPAGTGFGFGFDPFGTTPFGGSTATPRARSALLPAPGRTPVRRPVQPLALAPPRAPSATRKPPSAGPRGAAPPPAPGRPPAPSSGRAPAVGRPRGRPAPPTTASCPPRPPTACAPSTARTRAASRSSPSTPRARAAPGHLALLRADSGAGLTRSVLVRPCGHVGRRVQVDRHVDLLVRLGQPVA